jgi:hypothetical protein
MKINWYRMCKSMLVPFSFAGNLAIASIAIPLAPRIIISVVFSAFCGVVWQLDN